MPCMVAEHGSSNDADIAVSRLAKLASKNAIDLIQGAGHDVMSTHTDVVNQSVLEFLNLRTGAENAGSIRQGDLQNNRARLAKRDSGSTFSMIHG